MSRDVLRVWIMPTQGGSLTARSVHQATTSFRRSNPQVRLEFRILPWARAWHEIVVALQGNRPPDVLQVGTSWMATLAHLEMLDEVPPWVEDEPCLAGWMDGVVTFHGLRVAVPWVLEGSGLLVRLDLLDRVGVPIEELSDWNGMLKAAQRVLEMPRSASDPPLAALGLTSRPEPVTLHNMAAWLWGGGWKLAEGLMTDAPVLADPSVIPGLDIVARLMGDGTRASETQPYRLWNDFYRDGRFLMLAANPWSIVRKAVGALRQDDLRFPVGYVPVPGGPGGMRSRGGGSVLAVPRATQRRELSWEFVHTLVGDEFANEWVRITGEVPAHRGRFWRSMEGHPDIDRMRRSHEGAWTYPAHPMWTSIESILARGLSEIMWKMFSGVSAVQAISGPGRDADSDLSSVLRMAWDLEVRP